FSFQKTKDPSEINYFFFSSRRRHTRFSRDWSSDVCSSDLRLVAITIPVVSAAPDRSVVSRAARVVGIGLVVRIAAIQVVCHPASARWGLATELARATRRSAEAVAVLVFVEGRAIAADAIVIGTAGASIGRAARTAHALT